MMVALSENRNRGAGGAPPGETPTYFYYDGQLNRYAIDLAGTVTYYLWDGLRPLEERHADGSLKARYTHGHARNPDIGTVVEVERIAGGATYFQYLHMDHRGTVYKVTDAAENTQLEYTQDAFGRELSAPGGADPTVPNDLVVQTNGLTLTIGGVRYLALKYRLIPLDEAAFLSRDFLPFINLYRAWSNNPVGQVDYDGLASETPPKEIPLTPAEKKEKTRIIKRLRDRANPPTPKEEKALWDRLLQIQQKIYDPDQKKKAAEEAARAAKQPKPMPVNNAWALEAVAVYGVGLGKAGMVPITVVPGAATTIRPTKIIKGKRECLMMIGGRGKALWRKSTKPVDQIHGQSFVRIKVFDPAWAGKGGKPGEVPVGLKGSAGDLTWSPVPITGAQGPFGGRSMGNLSRKEAWVFPVNFAVDAAKRNVQGKGRVELVIDERVVFTANYVRKR